MKGQIFIITGPSGVGKTEISKRILANLKLNTQKVITCTTRPKREGEIDGKDYFFLSKEEFEENLKNNKFFEFANVYGNYYGSRKEDVEKILHEGTNVLFVIDVQGAVNMKKLDPECKVIFIQAESLEELKGRLLSRKSDDESVIEKRLSTALTEMESAQDFDFTVDNLHDKLGEAVRGVEKIISAKV
jgi:guanylate kinase